MSTSVYDSSAVDLYINELSHRQAEITRSRQIDNFIREVPYIALKWCGYILPIAILIWFLGHAISNAFSHETIVKHETLNQGFETSIREEKSSGDETIDVEAILASAKSQDPYFPEDEEKPQGESVRDYYIFDTLPIDNEVIQEVIIGRKYDEPNAAAQTQFCYINIWQADGIGQRLNLISIDEDGRVENPLDKSMAQKLNISLSELFEARAACTI